MWWQPIQWYHRWSDNSPVNCRTQDQDNSAVNLPKRGDCDGPTIRRWIRIHVWWQPISVMVRQFTGELSDTGSGQFSGESAQAWWQIQRWTFVPWSAPMNKETSVHIGRLVRSFICPIELKCNLKQHLQFQTSIWTHMLCVQGGGFEFLFRCNFRIIQRWTFLSKRGYCFVTINRCTQTNFLEEQFKN